MPSVKTAISIDKDLFDKARQLAREMGMPRSRLFAMAVDEYIQRQRNRKLLAQINAAHATGPDEAEKTLRRKLRGLHRRMAEGEW